ncbi:hypothetical protein F2Q69_00020599 [Brassica cretica]|uniref:Uncharacterized protein n=1 Tax=Brassica cretica TaxID=69181 RepID=A0A8S9QFV5_BRACR|nr:hypothetical protein F2Q69_00020599 [Brassica cretica]
MILIRTEIRSGSDPKIWISGGAESGYPEGQNLDIRKGRIRISGRAESGYPEGQNPDIRKGRIRIRIVKCWIRQSRIRIRKS